MSTSRIPWLVRSMHTGGRRVPHAPLGGAGARGPGGSSIPTPQEASSHPAAPHPDPVPVDTTSLPPPARGDPLDPNSALDPAAPSDSSDGKEPSKPIIPPRVFNRKGREIRIRDPRKTPVQLASGHPEPPRWPPPREYLEAIETMEPEPLHPLWQFFHVNPAASLAPNEKMEQPPEVGAYESFPSEWRPEAEDGRAWSANELRLKSFAELHTLWYILLKEKNILATQKEERRRLGVARGTQDKIWRGMRDKKVRQSMARIKHVLQERRLGLIATLGSSLKHDNGPLKPPSWADPANVFDAIRNQVDYEDVRIPKALRSVKVKNEMERKKEKEEKKRKKREAKDGLVTGEIDESEVPETTKREQQQTDARGTVVDDAEVSETEVEGRDGGYAGKEADEFVEGTKVDEDGTVKKV